LSYTRVRERRSILEHHVFCKGFLVLKIVDHHAFTTGFEHLLHEIHVEGVFLIGVLRGFILEHKVQCHLIGLVDNIPVALGHFAAVIVQDSRAGFKILFGSSEQFFCGLRDIRFGPKNDNV